MGLLEMSHGKLQAHVAIASAHNLFSCSDPMNTLSRCGITSSSSTIRWFTLISLAISQIFVHCNFILPPYETWIHMPFWKLLGVIMPKTNCRLQAKIKNRGTTTLLYADCLVAQRATHRICGAKCGLQAFLFHHSAPCLLPGTITSFTSFCREISDSKFQVVAYWLWRPWKRLFKKSTLTLLLTSCHCLTSTILGSHIWSYSSRIERGPIPY